MIAQPQGRVAINPQTGERVIVAGPAAQPPAPVSSPGFIETRPADPVALRGRELDVRNTESTIDSRQQGDAIAAEQLRLARERQQRDLAGNPGAGYRMTPEGRAERIPGGEADVEAQERAGKLEGARTRGLQQIRTALNAARRAQQRARDGYFANGGMFSGLLQNVRGTDAYALNADLETLRGISAFDALAEMRANSPTGGALGSVTERELNMLSNTIGTIDQGLNDEDFNSRLEEVIGNLERSYADLSGETYVPGLDSMNPGQRQAALGAMGRQEVNPPQPEGSLGNRPEIIARGDINPDSVTYGAAHRDRRIDEQARSALYNFNYGLLNGMPANELRATLRQQLGRDYNGPGVNVDQLIQERDQLGLVEFQRRYRNLGVNPESYSIAPPDITDTRGGEGVGAGVGERVDAFVRGAADTVTMGSMDELNSGLGSNEAELWRQRAIDDYDAENYGVERFLGQVGGGIALPFPAKNLAAPNALGRYAPQIGAGAGYGGAYGFGSGRGDLGARGGNALLYGTIGAVAPPAVDAALQGTGRLVGGVAARRAERLRGDPQTDTIRAFADEGMAAPRPFVDPTQRLRMATMETTQGGNVPVRSGIENVRGAIEGRVNALAGDGSAQTASGMGQAVREGVEGSVERQRVRASNLFGRAAREAEGATIQPTEIVRVLRENIARLERNPEANAGTLSYLQSQLRNFVDEAGNVIPKTVDDIRDVRTAINGEINRLSLNTTPAERMMNAALAAGRRDVERDLGAVAPRALQMYQQADEMWGAMHRDRRQLLERMVGPADNPLPPETVFANLNNMMRNRGDASRYRRIVATMPVADRRNYVATIMDGIGREGPDMPFSPARFLSATKDWSPEAVQTAFGPEGARSIANLRTASRAFREVERSLNNSRSGAVQNFDSMKTFINFRSGIGGMIGYAAGNAVGGPITGNIAGLAGAGIGAATQQRVQRLSAEALMNPDISRWLNRAARARTPGQANAATQQLVGIAQRNPALGRELAPLVRMLTAANDNAAVTFGRAAASNDGRTEQQERR